MRTLLGAVALVVVLALSNRPAQAGVMPCDPTPCDTVQLPCLPVICDGPILSSLSLPPICLPYCPPSPCYELPSIWTTTSSPNGCFPIWICIPCIPTPRDCPPV